ncbi:hypothetical protein DSO57_1026615 [Entomophthora muscae]|uniref:Uncharacterized protein n=1 Tax=Entomophthora muscae TaxID=34485 RepID=A0ACC2SEQ7_9FUNG|nr:hypothetical protein DSO57_1026615 [Entomophthora muscae]
MPVLHQHFQENTLTYIKNTEKVLGLAAMLSGNTFDWFGKATQEDVEFIMDYAKFEAELTATGKTATRYYTLGSLFEIQKEDLPIQTYINKFFKLKTQTKLEDKMTTIIFRKFQGSSLGQPARCFQG